MSSESGAADGPSVGQFLGFEPAEFSQGPRATIGRQAGGGTISTPGQAGTPGPSQPSPAPTPEPLGGPTGAVQQARSSALTEETGVPSFFNFTDETRQMLAIVPGGFPILAADVLLSQIGRPVTAEARRSAAQEEGQRGGGDEAGQAALLRRQAALAASAAETAVIEEEEEGVLVGAADTGATGQLGRPARRRTSGLGLLGAAPFSAGATLLGA